MKKRCHMGDYDRYLDVASFVRIYQSTTGMLIRNLGDIAYKQGIIMDEKMIEKADTVPCREYLKRLVVNHKPVETQRK